VFIALSPCHEGAEQNTIGVTKGINVKLPHYTNVALAYPVENKMPLVHHTIKW
jgi:hypothetical protein